VFTFCKAKKGELAILRKRTTIDQGGEQNLRKLICNRPAGTQSVYHNVFIFKKISTQAT